MADKRHRSRLYKFACIEEVLSEKMQSKGGPFEGDPIPSSSYSDEFIYNVKGTQEACLVKRHDGLVNGVSLSIVLRQLPYNLEDFKRCLN